MHRLLQKGDSPSYRFPKLLTSHPFKERGILTQNLLYCGRYHGKG